MIKNIIILISLIIMILIILCRLSLLLLSIHTVKKLFTCENCNKINKKYVKRCKFCNKHLHEKEVQIPNITRTMLFRQNTIDESGLLNYKKATKVLRLDIILSLIALTTLSYMLAVKVVEIL